MRAVAGAAGIEHRANVYDGQFRAGDKIYPRTVGRGPVLDLGIGSGGAARDQAEHGETNRQNQMDGLHGFLVRMISVHCRLRYAVNGAFFLRH